MSKLLQNEAVARAIRTFVIAFAGVGIPGALGWLNDLTTWAKGNGQHPFPDAHSLAFIGVAAVVAGVIALLNLAIVWLENTTGKGFLRPVPPPTAKRSKTAAGAADAKYVLNCFVLALVAIVLLLVLFGVLPHGR